MEEGVIEKMKSIELTEEEEEDIVISKEIRSRSDPWCCYSLVGKLQTEKGFNKKAMKDTLKKIRGMASDVKIVDVADNLFHFRFASKFHMQRILEGGPWFFDNALLLLQRWEPWMNGENISFSHLDIWVQVWNLPFDCRTKEIGEIIGRSFPSLIKVDDRLDDERCGKYIRLRVQILVDKPLRRGSYVTVEEGKKVWVQYKYERVPLFCYYCGIMGHGVRNCGRRWENEEEGRSKGNQYSEALVAFVGGRRTRGVKDGDRDRWYGSNTGGGSILPAVGKVRPLRGTQRKTKVPSKKAGIKEAILGLSLSINFKIWMTIR